MDVKRTAEQLADTLWDLLTDDRMGGHSVQHLSQDPNGFLASQGHEGVTSDDFEDAIDRLCDRLGPDHLTQVAPIRSVAQSLPVAPPPPAPAPAPPARPPSTRWPRSSTQRRRPRWFAT